MKPILIALLIPATLSGCGAVAYRDNIRAIERNALVDVYNYSVETRQYIIDHGESKALEAAKLSVKRHLKDPDSANFINVRTAGTKDGIVVCGEVNAKNSYGGYVGFNRFVSGISGSTIYDNTSRNKDVSWATNSGIIAACGM